MEMTNELNTKQTFQHLNKNYGKVLKQNIEIDVKEVFFKTPFKILSLLLSALILIIKPLFMLIIGFAFSGGGGVSTQEREANQAAYWRRKYNRAKHPYSIFRDAW